jgi:uncharacterized membrane protein
VIRPAGPRAVADERHLRIAGATLAAIGLAIAAYITIADSSGSTPVCLAGGHGCQTVAESSYADLAGVRVSAIGIAGYGLLLGAAATPGDPGRLGGFVLALIGAGFSFYLTYLEFGVIDAVCQWCVASAAVMCLLLVVNAWRFLAFAGTSGASGQEVTT